MDVQQIIRDAAARYGVDPEYALRTAQIESSLNPAAHNASGAAGLYQFIPSTWAMYGRGNPNDPAASADAAMRFARDNSRRFQRVFGRAPTAGEMYLMHQQGAEGATKLLQNPNAPAAELVGPQAVAQNGGRPGMTAAEFANLWVSKFGSGGEPAAQANTAGMQQSAQQSPLRDTLAALVPEKKPAQPQAGVIVGGQFLS